MLEEIFNEDLCLTIEDRIQVLPYKAIFAKDVLETLERHGISQVRRIFCPVSNGDIRCYLAAYCHSYKHPAAEIFVW